MITDPFIISTLALVAGITSLSGGIVGWSVFFHYQKHRAFIDFMNRKLSKGDDNEGNR
jgi:hypothetical protein